MRCFECLIRLWMKFLALKYIYSILDCLSSFVIMLNEFERKTHKWKQADISSYLIKKSLWCLWSFEKQIKSLFLWDLIRSSLAHSQCDKNCEPHFKHTLLMRWFISAVRPYFTPVYGFEHNLITRQLNHRTVKENKNIWSC